MKDLSIGTYSISNDGMTINYSAPSMLPIELLREIYPDDKIGVESEIDNRFTNYALSANQETTDAEEVTHKEYFGENIRRVVKTFKNG